MPFTFSSEASCDLTFKFHFQPKLKVQFEDNRFSLDFTDLTGNTDLSATCGGWASLAAQVEARVTLQIQVCTYGYCFDTTATVVQIVEAGADITAGTSAVIDSPAAHRSQSTNSSSPSTLFQHKTSVL